MSAPPDKRTLALLGGPDSGKTTYLGAMVLGLQRADDAASLAIQDLGLDARGLRRLAQPLRDGKYPQRTKEERHTLNVELMTQAARLPPTAFTLNIADYDGEEIERLFDHRVVPTMNEWQVRAEASGLLLFVRPAALTPLRTLTKRPTAVPAAAPTPAPLVTMDPLVVAEVPPPRPRAPDEPVRVPTVLGIIEVLQYLRALRGLVPGERPPLGDLRIGILLSSWDAVEPTWQQRRPIDYLNEHTPLLMDFLWSNFAEEDIFYFGLSATGGDLAKPDHRERYRADPRGQVYFARTGGQVESTEDLALPILWALYGDRALDLA